MEITEVRVSLREGGNKKLKAYATITFDNCFVVRNIKVIEGSNGLFVAMPAKKMKQFCSRCGKKVDVGSKYCSQCGGQIPFVGSKEPDPTATSTLTTKVIQTHQDIAHPINQQFRDYVQKKILDIYEQEKVKVKEDKVPVSHSLGLDDDEEGDIHNEIGGMLGNKF